jgi:diguanylate cyclase (GGDEF)-like protein
MNDRNLGTLARLLEYSGIDVLVDLANANTVNDDFEKAAADYTSHLLGLLGYHSALDHGANAAIFGSHETRELALSNLEWEKIKTGEIIRSNAQFYIQLPGIQRSPGILAITQEGLERSLHGSVEYNADTFLKDVVRIIGPTLSAIAKAEHHKESARLAYLDEKTGILNDRGLDTQYTRLCEKTTDGFIAVYVLDLDNFKQVNDNQGGHQVGDAAIVEFAKRIARTLRKRDVVGYATLEDETTNQIARYGGDEFVVIAKIKESYDAQIVADRMVRAVNSAPFDIFDKQIHLTTSIGYVVRSHVHTDISFQTMFCGADSFLYQAKEAGRNQAVGNLDF